MELRLPCIKPLKLYSVDGNRSIRRSYKSDAKGVKQGYFSFLGTATLSEATEQAVFSGYTCGYHIGKTNKQRRSQRQWNGYHNLSLQWLLWVVVFTNTAIDIVTIILTGIYRYWHMSHVWYLDSTSSIAFVLKYFSSDISISLHIITWLWIFGAKP